MVRQLIKGIVALFTAALLLGSSSVRADDTDIYFQPANTGAPPIIMFYIDYATNLNSSICTNVTWDNIATSCPQMASLQLYMARRTSANPSSSDDVVDTAGTITQFAMTRAALKRVLITMGNMKVGIVAPHNNNSNCAGPGVTGCSNGAEIYERAVTLAPVSSNFNPLDPTQVTNLLASDTNKAQLFRKLDRMRSPQGYFSAPYQDKEAYFELFRYLAGKGVYNGHNGWTDFGTGSTYNLGAWQTSNNNGKYNCSTTQLFSPAPTCSNSLDGSQYVDAPKQGNNYQGNYNGDFIVTSAQGTTPVTYMNSAPFYWDVNAESSGTYITPIDTNCQKIFFINIVDGAGQLANDSDTAINADFSVANTFTVLTNQPGTIQIAQWLYSQDLAGALGSDGTAGDGGINVNNNIDGKQNVISYFVAKHPDQVDAVAMAGSGNMTHAFQLTNDPQGVINALNAIFNQVLSVSTTFVAASIPVNSFNRSTTLDNVYISLFQVNPAGLPQWYGNVKKLKLAIVPVTTTSSTGAQTTVNTLEFVDFNGNQAIASDGRIMQTAQTFWTNRQTYLGYDLFDNIDTTKQEVAGDDGRSVTRGGSGEQIPGFTTYPTLNSTTGHYEATPYIGFYNSQGMRQLYTNDDSGHLLALSWANIVYLWPDLVNKYDPAWASMVALSQLNSPSTTNDQNLTYSNSATWMGSTYSPWSLGNEVYRLMYFIRGSDAEDVNNNGNNAEARRWQFGDALHSNPLTINYGARSGYSSSNPDVRILLGSNDGFLRMIRNTNTSGSDSGKEVWAYMPRELLHIQKTLMNNVGTVPATHPYGLDGAPVAYISDTDGTIGDSPNDKAWVFFGLRRGGRSYYALDITNPDSPSFKWKIDNTTPGFAELGYTFSTPVVAELDWGTGVKPVIIVGGGYDRNKDNIGLGTNDSMGNALFIIDADTGALVWKAVAAASTGTNVYVNPALVDSIPSDVSGFDSTGSGVVNRLYVGDTGGSVWRADLTGNDPSTWTMTKILNVGRHITNPTLADDRRFFYPPDVVPSRDASGNFDGVVIGSGDREHPLSTTTSDFMYMYKDRAVYSALGSSFTTLQHGDLTDITYLNDCLLANNCSPAPNLYNGWKLQMLQPGEKVVALPLTMNGIVYFPSYVPKIAGCGPNEGSGYQYEIALKNGTAVVNFYALNDTGGNAVLGMQDRYRALASSGIASGNYFVSYTNPADPTQSINTVCSSDNNCTQDLGSQQWTTYWFEKQK